MTGRETRSVNDRERRVVGWGELGQFLIIAVHNRCSEMASTLHSLGRFTGLEQELGEISLDEY